MKILYHAHYRSYGKAIPEIDLFVQYIVRIGETESLCQCFVDQELFDRICGSNIPAGHQLEGIGRKISGIYPLAERTKGGPFFSMVEIKTGPPIVIISRRGIVEADRLYAFDGRKAIVQIVQLCNAGA